MRGTRILEVAAVDATVYALLTPLLQRLAERGCDVHVACSGRGLGSLREAIGLPVHDVAFRRKLVSTSHAVAFLQLVRLLRRERFDVVHVHTPIASAIGRLAARAARTPHIVYTAHGFYFHDRMPRARRRVVIALERFLGRHCTDLVLSQSREDVEAALQAGIVRRPEDIVWIGNGVDTERFQPGRVPGTRDEFGFAEDDLVVGFVGRVVREKGLDELLAAMSLVRERVPAARLLVVGAPLGGDRGVRTQEHLDATVRRRELADVVRFAGARSDVPRLLTSCDVFVLPSHREGMPRSILEAMAAGLPVVATDIRGCREEVVQGETGLLVPVGDPTALGEALATLLADPEARQRMGRAGRQRAVDLFREALALDRQIAALEQLLAAPRGRRRETET